jgi:hypothetical protein
MNLRDGRPAELLGALRSRSISAARYFDSRLRESQSTDFDVELDRLMILFRYGCGASVIEQVHFRKGCVRGLLQTRPLAPFALGQSELGRHGAGRASAPHGRVWRPVHGATRGNVP